MDQQTTSHRIWAALALVVAIATLLFAVDTAISRFPRGLIVAACALVAVAAAVFGLVRRGALRWMGLAVAAVLLAVDVALMFIEHRPGADILIVAGILATLAAARQAFRVHVTWPPAQGPARPVLFYNPLSGDGKAERFKLADEARKRGIEPVELRRGDDLEQLVRDAVGRGADGLAMAGGDGSQAVVAKIAAELDLPYACIPAGTRNHFALDLGVDRDDVVGALDAFVDGGERRVDLAEVNGRVFVNNVSLGLYATAVQRPEYRGAKLRTLLETVPDSVGPEAAPPTLSWDGGDGEESAVAVLVSNNPYRLGRAIGSGTRPRLDRGLLGVAVIGPSRPGPDGGAHHAPGMRQWTVPTLEMHAEESVPAGIDGEALHLDPPLRFITRPAALRVRIAPAHPGASPSAREPDRPWELILALIRIALRGTPSS